MNLTVRNISGSREKLYRKKVIEQVKKNYKKEYHIDLGTLYDAASNRNQTGTMSSNGAVGCFATTKGKRLQAVNMSLHLPFLWKQTTRGSTDLATVDIADAITGESYVSGKLQASDLKDGVGEVHFSIPMSNAQNLQIRCFADSTVPVELTDIMYKKRTH